MLNRSATLDAPLTPGSPGSGFAIQGLEMRDTPKTKKERKAAKKAKKLAEMPKTVNGATVEHVAKVLHPNVYDAKEGELELQLLSDVEINDNRFFHKGTSNLRELRNEFVRKDRKGDQVIFRVEADQMEGILQLLNVSPITANTLPEEKKILEELTVKVEKDLVQAREANEGFMMRKAGFWRWASKKAYNRLVANGRIWEEKGEGSLAKSNESDETSEGDAIFSANSADASDDTNLTEPDSDVAESAAKLAVSTSKTPKSVMAAEEADGGWTSVSKPKAKESERTEKTTPQMTIKMSGNGGLGKMVQSSTQRSTAFLRYCSEDA